MQQINKHIFSGLFLTIIFIFASVLLPSQAFAWTELDGGDHAGEDWIISANTIIAGTHTNIGTFQIDPGVVVYVATYDSNSYGEVEIQADDIIINGTLSAYGRGYRRHTGPGAGATGGANIGGGGGGYGAYGGNGFGTSGTAIGGIGYGDILLPRDMGSGGGYSGTNSTVYAGAGGGVIVLSATTSLQNNGIISVNGENGTINTSVQNYSGGGGAGGSILITTSSFSGTGEITAVGGNGGQGGYYADGGGGSGGRIAIYYDVSTYAGTYLANGGYGNRSRDGGVGSIYIKDISNNISTLRYDGNDIGNLESVTYLDAGTYSVTNLEILNKTFFYLPPNVNLTTENISINGSFALNKDATSSISVTNPTNVSVDSSGFVYADFSGIFADITIQSTGYMVINVPLTLDNLEIMNGGILYHSGNSTQKLYYIDLTLNENFILHSGATVQGSERGYTEGNGPGTGTPAELYKTAGGGAYGGDGGRGNAAYNLPGGTAYGSLSLPDELGSGGGKSNYLTQQGANPQPGGKGGGLVKITAGGTIQIDGTINVNAQDALFPVNDGYWVGGGGAGGGIYLNATTFTGSGLLTANGGAGTARNGGYGSGGGGGGRIAIEYMNSDFSGTIQANGGSGASTAASGQAGEIITKAKQGEIISTPFDMQDGFGLINDISWTESLPVGTDVKFQLRTAPDNGGSPGTWTDWLGPNGLDTYYTDPSGGETINAAHQDTIDDQWFQYKAILSIDSAGENTPTLSDVSVRYVVNTPPTISISNNPSQNNSGQVLVEYSLSDPEEFEIDIHPFADVGISLANNLAINETSVITVDDASLLPQSGTILIGSEIITYTDKFNNTLVGTIERASSNTRAAAHSSGDSVLLLLSGVSGDTGQNVTTGNSKTLNWTPSTDFANLESGSVTLTLIANDGNLANQQDQDVTTSFAIDTAAPDSTGIIANVKNATLALSAADSAAIEMKLSNNSDLTGDGVNPDSGTWISYAATKSWVFPDQSKTVYVMYKDAYGNETATLSTTAPDAIQNVLIQDVSNVESTDHRLFVSWEVAVAPPEGFAYYQVYRSTDNSTFSPLVQVANRSQNYYMDSGLDENLTYYYKVTTVDNNGNESGYNVVPQGGGTGTSGYSGTGLVPDGSGGSDFTAPVISNATASAITTTTATITWNTDELADGKVGFSENTQYDTEVGSISVTTDHSIVLSNLEPSTTYYYRMISYDPSSNKAIEEDSQVYTFTTADDTTAPTISSVTSSPGETTAGITWATDESSTSLVEYGLTSALGSTASDSSLVLGHSVQLSDLDLNTTYYYRVSSEDALGNSSFSPTYTFTTTSSTGDEVAPSISDISVSNVGAFSATVSWNTNEVALGQVEYGESTDYERGITEGNHEFKTTKTVSLIGLQPETTYHYRVIAIDAAGNTNTTADATFSTGSESSISSLSDEGGSYGSNAPSISSEGGIISEVTGTTATVVWSTSKKTKGFVYYRVKDSIDDLSTGSDGGVFDVNHEVVLTNLLPGTTYEYQVKSIDSQNNYVLSKKFEFTTSLPGVAGVSVSNIFESTADIAWSTAIPTQTTLEYLNTLTGETLTFFDKNLVKSHLAKLTNLYPNTPYSFSFLINDENGNQARSEQYTFITKDDNQGPQISGVNSQSTIVSGKNQVQTVITWSTLEPSNSKVEYSIGQQSAEFNQSSPVNSDFVNNHIVVLPNLQPSTIYKFRVVSADRAGNVTQSEPYVLLTPQKDVSAIDLIIRNLESSFGWLKRR